MRLAKFLANAGIASRRAAEEIIRSGAVTLNGVSVTDPARDVSDADAIAVDGESVSEQKTSVVYAVNKPLGVVSTASDPQNRPTVVSLVRTGRRLYPVGRLDIDTTGLILLTDDGALAHRLTHPSFEVEKTYVATVRNPPVRDRALKLLSEGLLLQDGRTAPAKARRLAGDKIELTLREGRKRQVKRMLEEVGHRVIRLERVRFGPLELGALKPGAHRRLTAAEIERLRGAAGADRRSSAASSAARPRQRRR
ncbi:MAG: pseudouridine synthase [Solirubrobacteraceae bacterium]